MICLSKNLTDEYINMFAQGGNLPIYDYDHDFQQGPIVIRSMGKRKLIDRCWRDGIEFYYMDSGYFLLTDKSTILHIQFYCLGPLFLSKFLTLTLFIMLQQTNCS